MKTVLAFETSSPVLSVALGRATGKIREIRSKKHFQHSESLIPLIDALLKKEKISFDQIDAFLINRGPGSFTGLRIGFSLLKGFLAIRKIPCYGASSLDMITAGIQSPEASRLGVLIDARREKIYGRFYQRQKGEWVAEGKVELLSLPELMTRISKGTKLVGDALSRYRAPLENNFGKEIHCLPEDLGFPSARTLAAWFQRQDRRLALLKSPKDFSPLYFRASEAEEHLREKINYGA